MEINVFEVRAERDVTKWDIDKVPYEDQEEFYENLYATKVSAIRKAQKIFSKWICRVRVIKVTIGEQGVVSRKLVYHKY